MITLLLYQLLLLFGIVLLFILIVFGYLNVDYVAMMVMMILTIFFSYIYHLLIFNKDDKVSDKKRVTLSSLVFFPGVFIMLFLTFKTFVQFF